MTLTVKDKPGYFGHRQRLREKFLQAAGDGLADYELLELILCQALPRQDVKPLAKMLLEKFGSLANVFTASPEELKQVNGIGDTSVVAIKIVYTCCSRLLKQQMKESIRFHQPQDIIKYYYLKISHSKREEFHVLFLNQKMDLIKDEIVQTGTINYINLFPRELVKRALEVSALHLIFIHNHPTGDAAPSSADEQTTAILIDLFAKLGITVIDHLIISPTNCYSFKTRQYLTH